MIELFRPGTLRRLLVLLCLLMIAGTACRNRGQSAQSASVNTSSDRTAETTAIALLLSAPTPTFSASPTAGPSPTPTRTPVPTATPQPATRLTAAAEAVRLGDYEIARGHYEQLRRHPRYGEEAVFRLGDLVFREEDWVEAVGAWLEYLERWPRGRWAPEVHFMVGRALAAIGRHAEAIGHFEAYDDARDVADDAVAERLAESLAALGRDDEATAQFERVYALRGEDRVQRAIAAHRLADHFAELEAWDEAVEWYRRVLEDARLPEYRAEVMADLAEAHSEGGDDATAREVWQKIIAEYPETTPAYRALVALEAAGIEIDPLAEGRILIANEEWSAAIEALYESMQAEPHSADLHWLAARAYEGARNLEGAFKEYGSLTDTHPESDRHAAAWLARGEIRAIQGRYDEALEIFEAVASDYPEGEEALAAMMAAAQLLAERGRPDDAAERYAEVAARYPDGPEAPQALWEAGLLHFRLGEHARAGRVWGRLAEIDTEDGEEWRARALFWQGKAAAGAGDTAAATASFQKAAELDGYYAYRAAAYLAGTAEWPARAASDFSVPDVAGDSLAWLSAAAGITATQAFDPLALPDDSGIARGDELIALNLHALAMDAYTHVLDRHARDPLALYALAHHFAAYDARSLSIAAAHKLVDVLKLTEETTPPALAVLAYPIPYDTLLRETAGRFGVDPLLLAALVHQESLWQPGAVSSVGARGLTQVMPATGQEIARNLGVSIEEQDLERPRISLTFGGSYLDWALRLFEDNTFAALAAYNGGAGNVEEWLVPDDDLLVESITLAETRLYVERVYDHWHAYVTIYRTLTSRR